MALTIGVIEVGQWKENCYLVALDNEGWLIDPGDEVEKIISHLNLDHYQLSGIINTHGHFDHIGAVADLKEKYKIPFLIHSRDKRLVNQGNLYRRMAGGTQVTKTPVIDKYLDNLTFLKLKNRQILIHFTPGHTEGGICFEIDQNLFAGDLIFENSIGRTDLPGGNNELLQNSINHVFDCFSGYLIHPGHGKSFILDKNLIGKLKLII